MTRRNTEENPHLWEDLSWGDMTVSEQQLWSTLGWNQARWDRNDPPPSAAMEWGRLSQKEQLAAGGLGFTEELWNSTEDL